MTVRPNHAKIRMDWPLDEVKESGLLAGYGAEPHIQFLPKGCAPLGSPPGDPSPGPGLRPTPRAMPEGAGRTGVLDPRPRLRRGRGFNILIKDLCGQTMRKFRMVWPYTEVKESGLLAGVQRAEPSG
jgi:hypothetical protein